MDVFGGLGGVWRLSWLRGYVNGLWRMALAAWVLGLVSGGLFAVFFEKGGMGTVDSYLWLMGFGSDNR